MYKNKENHYACYYTCIDLNIPLVHELPFIGGFPPLDPFLKHFDGDEEFGSAVILRRVVKP
jgi:hypothetical protein